MWSCLVACQIYVIILVAVDLFNIGNRRVKEFLKLVPTSVFWLWRKQPCCSDVHTFSTFSHCVLSSVNSQLLLLMGGNVGSTLTVWLFIWMCNSRLCSFGHECLGVTHVTQSAGIQNDDDRYLSSMLWHLLGNQLSAVLLLLGMACACGEKWGLPSVPFSQTRGRRERGVSWTNPALPSCTDFREWGKHYSLKGGAQAGSLGSSLWTQGEEFWRLSGVTTAPLPQQGFLQGPWARAAGWDLSCSCCCLISSIPAGCFHKS